MQSCNLDCIPKIAELCREASSAILFYYKHTDKLNIQTKTNNTPVTQADIVANKILSQGLSDILPIPVLSEEAQHFPDKNTNDYWLIDPIDGTTAFIAGTDEFCIAIARIKNNQPVIGFIYSPISNEYWYALKDQGSYKYLSQGIIERLNPVQNISNITVITPQRKKSKRMLKFIDDHFGKVNMIAHSSALKFVFLAENKANIYPKLSPTTCEWDTAAGDILLREIGGGIYYYNAHLFKYGSRETIVNPPFIAYNQASFSQQIPDWYRSIEQLAVY